jgi:SAM-dependent methyltransferase
MKTIDDVKQFWESNPLWQGESRFEAGTRPFFEEHRAVIVEDCFAGSMDERLFPSEPERQRVLDLGCGIGFWTVEFGLRGYREVTAADLTERAVELTRVRCALYNVHAAAVRADAEHLPFGDNSFTHVNCQGVIHHTPAPGVAIAEIARVLEPGGTASVSVYYRNLPLRLWPVLRPLGGLALRAGAALRGRRREGIFALHDADEIVRTYDGADNPIGIALTRDEFRQLLQPHFEIVDMFLHFFPARTLPVRIPRRLHAFLDRVCGFMIYASLRRR